VVGVIVRRVVSRREGVVVGVVASQGCRGRGRRIARVSWSRLLRCVGVAVAVCCAVCGSQSPSLRCMWHRGCRCCAVWASRWPSLHGMGVVVAVFARRGCRGHSRRTMWCCGCGGRCHAAWCRSCSHRCHIITGLQKRKLVEKRKKKTYKQVDVVRAAVRGTATQCHRGW